MRVRPHDDDRKSVLKNKKNTHTHTHTHTHTADTLSRRREHKALRLWPLVRASKTT